MPPRRLEAAVERLDALLDSGQYAQGARQFAHGYRQFDPVRAGNGMLQACLKLLGPR